MNTNILKDFSESWKKVSMKLAQFTDEQLIDELRYRHIWNDEIDEEKLCTDRCMAALEYYPTEREGGQDERASLMRVSFGDGYDAGYRKAKENSIWV